MTPSRPGTGANPGRPTAAACAGVLAGLDPEDAGADPDEAAFALADLASASRFAIADLASASLFAITDLASLSLSRD